MIKGEAVLFDKFPVKSGTTRIALLLHQAADLEDVQIRIFLDGKEMGTWNIAALSIGPGLYRLEIMLPSGGVLKGVILDPRMNLDHKQVNVDIDQGSVW